MALLFSDQKGGKRLFAYSIVEGVEISPAQLLPSV